MRDFGRKELPVHEDEVVEVEIDRRTVGKLGFVNQNDKKLQEKLRELAQALADGKHGEAFLLYGKIERKWQHKEQVVTLDDIEGRLKKLKVIPATRRPKKGSKTLPPKREAQKRRASV